MGGLPKLYFNYECDDNRVWKDPALQQHYAYDTEHPMPGQEGLIVRM